MNKKGFTLIELLAVILILAIIALIAVPIILGVIENARKGAFKDSVYGVIESADIAVIQDELQNESDLHYPYVFSFSDPDVNLTYKGKTMTSGTIVLTEDGTIVKNVTDGVFCASGMGENILVTSGFCEEEHVFKEIKIGTAATYAIDYNGDLYAWGTKIFANSAFSSDKPVRILEDKKFKSLSLNISVVFATTVDGEVYGFGWNYYGQVGVGYTSDYVEPTRILINGDESIKIKKVVAGNMTSMVLTEDGTAYGVGYNQYCLIGDNCACQDSNNNCQNFSKVAIDEPIKDIHISEGTSFFLTENNKLYAVGSNNVGQYGNGTTNTSATPVVVNENYNYKEFYTSGISSFYIANDDKLYGVGKNDFYQLGLGNKTNQSSFQFIMEDVDKFFNSPYRSIVITKNGDVFHWGSKFDETTHAEEYYVKIPTKLELPTKIKKAFIGFRATILIDEYYNYYGAGQLNLVNTDFPNKAEFNKIEIPK